MSRNHRTLAKLYAVVAALLPSQIAEGQVFDIDPIERQPPNSSKIRINEFQPDPEGADSWGKEYVELTNASPTNINLFGWKIRNEWNAVIGTLPNITIPGRDSHNDRNYYLVVVFGPTMPSQVDNNFLDGDYRAYHFTGAPAVLSNNAGAILIERPSGKIEDAVVYGDQDPTGAGLTAIRAAGHWEGPRIDLAYSSGGIPIAEGGVLGRDLDANDYHKATDWRVDGGRNAFGPTPGRQNNSAVFGSLAEFIDWSHKEVNNLIAVFSSANASFVSIVDASHGTSTVTDPDLFGGFSATLNNQFEIALPSGPNTETLEGDIELSYERSSGHSFHLTMAGTLQSSSYIFTFDVLQSFSGFGTSSRTVTATYDTSWTQGNQTYAYDNAVEHTETWVSQTGKAVLDHREWQDWGGLNKVSDRRDDVVIIADGVTDMTQLLVRTFPFVAPSFGGSQSVASEVAVSEFDVRTTIDSNGLLYRVFSQYDHSFALQTNPADPFQLSGKTKRIGLQPGALGLLTETRNSGDPWDELGSFEQNGVYPLEYYNNNGSVAASGTYETQAEYEFSLTTNADGATKLMRTADTTMTLFGQTVSFGYAIDPVVQGCGCGCGSSSCTCGGSNRGDERSTFGKVVFGIGAVFSGGACAAGAVGTGGTGAWLAGSLSAGAILLWDEIIPGS